LVSILARGIAGLQRFFLFALFIKAGYNVGEVIKVYSNSLMKKLYSPQNEAELAVMRSILDGEKIHYFVHNDHFGTMRIGPKIDLFNAKSIMVFEAHFERASELISDYLNNVQSEIFKSEYSLKDKIRMIIETLLFSWFIPGKKWRKKSE
jgi:hypothetical protein